MADKPKKQAPSQKRYSDAIKQQALARVRNGEPVAKVAKSIGTSETSIHYWQKHAGAITAAATAAATALTKPADLIGAEMHAAELILDALYPLTAASQSRVLKLAASYLQIQNET